MRCPKALVQRLVSEKEDSLCPTKWRHHGVLGRGERVYICATQPDYLLWASTTQHVYFPRT